MPLPDSGNLYNMFNLASNVRCLCTIIRNPTNTPRFVLIPWHGTTIGANSTVAFIGSIADWLQRKRYRTRMSFLQAVIEGKLQILQTPLPVSYYTTTDASGNTIYNIKTLSTKDQSGSPAVQINNACWLS